MALVTPDWLILSILKIAENLVAADLDLWAPIIWGAPVDEDDLTDPLAVLLKDVKTFIRSGHDSTNLEMMRRNKIKYRLGYPDVKQEWPCMIVVLGAEQESTRGIGEIFLDASDDMDSDESNAYIKSGSLYTGTIRIGCYSANPQITLYLQALAKFALHYYRDALEATYGILKQSITCEDLQYAHQSEPNRDYVRWVNLTCSYEQTYVEAVDALLGIDIAATWKDNQGEVLGTIETSTGEKP